MWIHRSISLLLLVPVVACQPKAEAPGASEPIKPMVVATQPPPPPPPPPATSLGSLDAVQRTDKATLHALCADGTPGFLGVVSGKPEGGGDPFTSEEVGGRTMFRGKPGVEIFNTNLSQVGLDLCEREGAARAGNQFVVLKFSGKRQRSVDDEMMKFLALSASGTFARVEGQSWIEDGSGKKYRNAAVVAKDGSCALAFEVPAGATGLTWHDGKTAYALEPHPREVAP